MKVSNQGVFQNVTANSKIAMVNNRLGNPSLKKNQGSSVEIWDYQIVTATIGTAQTIRFFTNVNTKNFPFTNIQQAQLQVGESLAIQYLCFSRLEVEKASGKISTQTPINATITGLSLCNVSFLLDNSRIIKNNSLTRTNSVFNPKGGTASNYLFYPDTDLTLPPQITFSCELTIPANTDANTTDFDTYYGCHLFGTGAILNLKTNV